MPLPVWLVPLAAGVAVVKTAEKKRKIEEAYKDAFSKASEEFENEYKFLKQHYCEREKFLLLLKDAVQNCRKIFVDYKPIRKELTDEISQLEDVKKMLEKKINNKFNSISGTTQSFSCVCGVNSFIKIPVFWYDSEIKEAKERGYNEARQIHIEKIEKTIKDIKDIEKDIEKEKEKLNKITGNVNSIGDEQRELLKKIQELHDSIAQLKSILGEY
ncbi:MAG: hypothetical protein J6A58_03475 [Oscillospiraceae bacterium]|nr:hypothetical protein [Oscillospiraceae bacterium]